MAFEILFDMESKVAEVGVKYGDTRPNRKVNL